MFVVASDGRQISLVSSCFIYVEDEFKIRQKSTEISREYPILMRFTVIWMHKKK